MILLAFGAIALLMGSACAADDAPRPNFVFFLADDLGYSDVGCFGQQKIRTPRIDRLAAVGMRLTQHYCGNAVCAPSRCVLMTGMHPGHAFIRTNLSVPPEGQYPIPDETVTIAELLQSQGYATGGFGKWGLGPPASEGDPLRQGFDRFFGYLCQAVAHNHYPAYLWNDGERMPLDNPTFSAHQRLPEKAELTDPKSYAGFVGNDYAPDLFSEQARQFIKENRDRPFFLYVPTTIPHLSLQVPDDSLAEYAGTLEDEPYDGSRRYLPHIAPHAAYAAMVTRMDRELGRIVDLVEELGLTEQTVFVFSSDNGPTYEQLGGSDSEYFESAGALRGRKGSLYEGGIRVPTVVRWKGHIEPGTVSDRVTGFEDWLPTFLQLAGADSAIPENIDGIGFAATLQGEEQEPRPFLYREFPSYDGQQLVRIGDWKGVRQNLMPEKKGAKPNLHIELYNLADDPNEEHDVSRKHPEVVAQIERVMRQEHTPSAVFPLPALDGTKLD